MLSRLVIASSLSASGTGGRIPRVSQGFPSAPARPLPSFRARQASLVQPGRPSAPPSLTTLPPFNLSLRSGDRARSDRTDSIPKRRTFR